MYLHDGLSAKMLGTHREKREKLKQIFLVMKNVQHISGRHAQMH